MTLREQLNEVPLLSYAEYQALEARTHSMDEPERQRLYWLLARADRWFLVRYVLFPKYFTQALVHPEWIFDRCRETQRESDQIVDVWARFHWKSNIKTTAALIQEVLIDPNMTTTILSHTRPIAKAFLAQIQREIKQNPLLQQISWHPEIDGYIFGEDNLVRDSLDEGIIVPRTANPREATFSAYGLVDSMPTGMHFRYRCIDDGCVRNSVTTAVQKQKTIEAWQNSQPLGMPTGDDMEAIHGTFWAFDELYHHMVKSAGYKLRIHPMVEIDEENTVRNEDGHITRLAWHKDKPVLYKLDKLMDMAKSMGEGEGAQAAMLQLYCDPTVGTATGFAPDWLEYYETPRTEIHKGANVIILVDPAGGKEKSRSHTAIWVLALRDDGNIYVADFYRDNYTLSERADILFRLHRKYRPYRVLYERQSMQADTEHLRYRMAVENYRFRLTEVTSNANKLVHIGRLQPWFEEGRILLPRRITRKLKTGQTINLVGKWVDDEYLPFPASSILDGLDALAQLTLPEARLRFPDAYVPEDTSYGRRDRVKARHQVNDYGWLTA